MPQSLDNEIQQLVRLAGNVTDAFTAALFLVDERRGDLLRLKAYQSLSTNIVSGAEIPMGCGLIGWVAKNERPTNAPHFGRDTTTLKFYSKDEDIKSFAAAPLFDGGRVIGVLSIDSKRQYVFTDKVVKLLSEFADAISLAISHGKRRMSLDSRASAFDALSDLIGKITACSKISELAGALRLGLNAMIPHDCLALAVRSGDEDRFYMIRPAGALAADMPKGELPLTHYRLGWVIQQARPISIPDLNGAPAFPGGEGEWKSFLGAPIAAHDQVTGAIGLLSRKAGAFGPVDVKSVSIIASSLSSAFTSLYLHNKSMKSQRVDHLTKTLTHRSLQESHGSFKGEGAVAIVNLVGFTKINHDLGLDAGDSVIIDLAARLKEALGERGAVSRYYGDRFILAMRDIRKDDSLELVRGVIDSVESVPFHCQGVDIYASPSIGVAFAPEDGVEMEELIAKAQVASERAKSVPGLRVSIYGDPQAPWQGALKSVKGR